MKTQEPQGLTDLHSHLVPGVDDGARTVEDALEGIGRLWEAGVRRIVTTPHLDGSLTQRPIHLEARLGEVDLAWEALGKVVGEKFPELRIDRGHEVMLDVPDPVLTDSRIRLAGTSFVLIEWSHLKVPPSTPQVLARFRDLGMKVILAHPERYHGLDPESNLPREWRRMGTLLQVNYGSLVGRYGESPRKRALALLERGWADLLSTDFHGRPHLSLYIHEARAVLEMLGGGEHFDILARRNPARVVEGMEVLSVPPLSVKRGLRDKVLQLLRGREKGVKTT